MHALVLFSIAALNEKMERGQCKTSPDSFCYVCGNACGTKKKRKQFPMNSSRMLEGYLRAFGFAATNLEKPWTPSSICGTCKRILNIKSSGQQKNFPFAKPMLWREQSNHDTDCYFCLFQPFNTGKNTQFYPDVQSVTKPELHSETLPSKNVTSVPSSSKRSRAADSDSGSSCNFESEKRHFFSQAELNDLVRDLYLSKSNAELLASRLRHGNHLAPETKITFYRNRSKPLEVFFAKSSDYIFCNNIPGLFAELGLEYISNEWRLFIDGGKNSLKAVLLHKGNKQPSIPIGYARNKKENYESMTEMLKLVQYEKHEWKVCSDLKIVAILMGLQGGNTKYPCPKCLWDSRDRESHYTQRDWSGRDEIAKVGDKNVKNVALIKRENIILPPLHIKLGLFTSFAKKLDNNGPAKMHLTSKFRVSPTKIENGILNGPQIRALYNDSAFEYCLSPIELDAWKAFKDVAHNFLGNNRSENYREIVENLVEKYKILSKSVIGV